MDIALMFLNRLGISFPEEPTPEEVGSALQEMQASLTGRPIRSLTDLPMMTNPGKILAMRVLAAATPVSYHASPNLMLLMVLKQVDLSLEYGNVAESGFSYVCYGFILCGIAGDIESGYQFGRLALDLLERLGEKGLKAQTIHIFYELVMPWKEHIREALQPLLENYQTGLETGVLEYAAYSIHAYCHYSYFIGKPLLPLEEELAMYSHAVARFKQETALGWNHLSWQVALNLMGYSEDPCCVTGKVYDENIQLPIHQQADDRIAIHYLHINKCILHYLFQEYGSAVENADIAEEHLNGVTGEVTVAIFHFYDSLARLALYPSLPQQEQDAVLTKISANQEKMRQWVHHAPMNHLHKFYLVEAEHSRVLGKDGDAREFYDKAIELARENEYLSEEAMAYELAGQFYLAKGKSKIAQVYLRDAHYTYQQWGAAAKKKDMEIRYPEFLSSEAAGDIPTDATILVTGTTSTKGGSAQLDLSSVMKAAQTLSGEIVLNLLLEKMMGLVIENAGAEKGFLLLEKGGEWLIEAEGDVDRDEVRVMQSVGIGESDAVCAGIIHYVARTLESVVLDDAANKGDFSQEAHIRKHRSKSVLCMPLLHKGELNSILYLENSLTTGAFTPERLELLEVLASQAAISMENASLYANLEQKVEERTLELNQALKKIMASIRYAERIQRALLPPPGDVKTYLPGSFFLWMPRDIVGGDIYFTERFEDGIIVAVIDCTGHGVPGAFMSMIASSFIRRITVALNCHDPAEILRQLSHVVRTSLQQDRKDAPSDDGLDAAVCFIETRAGNPIPRRLIFAGARLPLFYVHNREMTVIKEDRQSIGYKRSNPDFEFTNHTIPIEGGMSFYMSTDGFWDQLGKNNRRFGKQQFTDLLTEISDLPFEIRQERLAETFHAHKGEMPRQDDVTVVGFGF